eukprot:29366-Pelagomonas_calceolata.AAC.3
MLPQEILRRYLLLSRSSLTVRDEELEVPAGAEAAAAAYATMTDDLAAVHEVLIAYATMTYDLAAAHLCAPACGADVYLPACSYGLAEHLTIDWLVNGTSP